MENACLRTSLHDVKPSSPPHTLFDTSLYIHRLYLVHMELAHNYVE